MGFDYILTILHHYPPLQYPQGLFKDNSRPLPARRGKCHPLLGYTHAQTKRRFYSVHNLGGRADGILQEKDDP